MAETTTTGEMKRTLGLTGITVNAMALIAPGAFLWTTFQMQSAQVAGNSTTAFDMWTGLFFALVLAFLTAYSYSELARIYPQAGTGSSYYFAEAALLNKEKAHLRRFARVAKLTIGWISHLYYWIYPGIMVAFTATLFGYIYQTLTGQALSWPVLSVIAIVFALITGYIAFRGISGSTNTAIAINVIQLTTLLAFGIVAIAFRLSNPTPTGGYEMASASSIILPRNILHLIYQSTIAILLLVGFESVTALGAEAKRPEKDIKRGVLLSLAIQGGLAYLFEYFAANFVVGGATVTAVGDKGAKLAGYAAAATDSAPIGTMVKTIVNSLFGAGGQAIALLMAATVLLALIGTTLACLNTGVRVTYSMARDKEMPSILGLLHGKFATPHGGIWILTAISALFGIYGVKTVDTLTQITLASNAGTFLVYGMTCLVAIVAFASHKDRHLVKHYVVPGAGMLMNLAMLVGIIYLGVTAGGATSTNVYIAISIVAVWIVIGAAWVALNPSMRGVKLLQDPRGTEIAL
ncbi:MAG: APC family permease [Actinobacteria bacterium]|nr:APC family permease [Actinomycetota bacterium]